MEKKPKLSKLHKIGENIINFLRFPLIISVTVFLSVLAYRIARSDLKFDFSKFDFSDLLALVLSLFAMAISVAFYFQSTDSSNQFYNFMHKFTSHISETLGRIEERFGEKLKHIEELQASKDSGIIPNSPALQKEGTPVELSVTDKEELTKPDEYSEEEE